MRRESRSRTGEGLHPEAPATVEPTSEELVQEAIKVAEAVVRRFPTEPYPYDVLAGARCLLGNTAKVEACWNRCLELDPDFAPAYYGLAAMAGGREDYERVATLMRKVLASEPSSSQAQLTLARALLELGKFEEAAEVVKRHIEDRPDSTEGFRLLGKAYLQLERNEDAKESYERAIALDPNCAPARYGLGMVCRKLGEYEKAREALDQFRRRRPKHTPRNPMTTEITSRPKSLQEAIVTHLAAGEIYAMHGNLREAEGHWSRAAALDSRNIDSRRALASLYQKQGRTREALKTMAEVRQIESSLRRRP